MREKDQGPEAFGDLDGGASGFGDWGKMEEEKGHPQMILRILSM